jgi:hypothetical protein
MGSKVNTGVNKNGVQWMRVKDTYYCLYYYGDGAELFRSFKGVQQSFIENLDLNNLQKKDKA